MGPRRVGKTEPLREIAEINPKNTLWLNGDDVVSEELLVERSVAAYSRLLEGKQLLIIDEAQYISDIMNKAKLMIDQIRPLHIILSRSPSFDLVQSGAPLVGRANIYQLHPLSQIEWKQKENSLQTRQNLDDRLVYGGYPELSQVQVKKEKEIYLKEIVQSYLLNDILPFENIRNAHKIKDLLVLLAYQIGFEVSMNELGTKLGISKNTVERYIDLLCKAFVLFPLNAYSNNLRKEISKNKKWYFVDNGIRNAIINDFSPMALRKDKGALWEQYLLNERKKFLQHQQSDPNIFFWRTYDQQKVDYLEVYDGKCAAWEFKHSEKTVKVPIGLKKAYPDATFEVISSSNYLDWIGA